MLCGRPLDVWFVVPCRCQCVRRDASIHKGHHVSRIGPFNRIPGTGQKGIDLFLFDDPQACICAAAAAARAMLEESFHCLGFTSSAFRSFVVFTIYDYEI